jgi:DNA polymerase delta subunit 1
MLHNQLNTQTGDDKPFIRNIFTVDTCSPITGHHVLSFNDEGNMIRQWGIFIRALDPDIIIGYNILNFDLPYLLERAEVMKINKFPFLGRIKSKYYNV